MLLAERSAIVTGASRGIGLAIASVLSAHGMRVFMLARSHEPLIEAAHSLGASATAVHCDVTDAEQVARAADHITSGLHGQAPDVIVNNAGLFPLAALDAMSVDDFARTIDVNLIAPFRLLRSFLPAMKTRGAGHIITVGSVADRAIFPGNGAYAASKFGQRAMHEVLAAELKGTGVRRTLISPAATDTPIWDAIDPDNKPGFPTRASMLRASDVADAVLWAITRPHHVNIDELRISSS